MINELQMMYSFEFMRNALLVGVFGGGLLAFLGVFIHLKRIVFLGAALPQLAALGIAVAMFLHLPFWAGAMAGVSIGMFLLSFSGKPGSLPAEGWIGLAYAAGGSIAFVLVALAPHPDAGALRFFTGDILGTRRGDACLAIGVAVLTALIFRLCWSKLVVVGFDPVMASTLGMRVRLWNVLLFVCLGAGLATVMNTAGGMLAFSMLVGPPAASLILFRSFSRVVFATVALGALSAFAGLTLSFVYDLPGGPAMATAALFPVIPLWGIRQVVRFRRHG